MTVVGELLRGPDGELREVVGVVRAEHVYSSREIRQRRHERSAIHVDPDLERKQAQQAPGGRA